MKHGFIKVAAATPELRVADPVYNADKIIREIEKQAELHVQLLVFPELSLSGYTCGDLFCQPLLLNGCLEQLQRIQKATEGKKMLVFVGLPYAYRGKLYNVAAALNDGRLLALIPKTFLPNYNEFYEARHFTPAPEKNVCYDLFDEEKDEYAAFGKKILFVDRTDPDFTVGCEICEDLWVPDSPSALLALNGANILVNLSASDEVIGKREYRRSIVSAQSGKCVCGYVYADCGTGESSTDMTFAGHNLIAENGNILKESKLFSGETIVSEIDVRKLAQERRKMTTFHAACEEDEYLRVEMDASDLEGELTREFSRTPFVPSGSAELEERAQLILSMQANALARRLKHTSAKTAVIGISGGLDSTLALLVTARAFDLIEKDKKDIVAITMPGFGTTGRTFQNSLTLIDCVGATSRTVKISDSVLQHFKDIGHDKDILDVTYENAQARTRTMILMNTANKTGGLVIGTGDLSELALGWCTYNGDHMSMYAVNSSVPKTLVKYLVRSEAERLGGNIREVLLDILDTEISPELLPPDKDGKIAQKTEDIVGPYELHDFFLYYAVRWGFEPEKVYAIAKKTFVGAYDNATLKKWLVNFYKRFFSQQFKRSCIPDGVKIGSVTLSPRADWRMPSDASSALWVQRAESIDTED